MRQLEYRSLGANAWTLAMIVLLSATANWCVGASIQGKNATVSGLVEMTYPLFTGLFAYLFFREVHVTPMTALGGIVVVIGLVVVAAGAR